VLKEKRRTQNPLIPIMKRESRSPDVVSISRFALSIKFGVVGYARQKIALNPRETFRKACLN